MKRSFTGGEEYIYPLKKPRSRYNPTLTHNLKLLSEHFYIPAALYLDNNTPIRTIEVTNIGDNICSKYLQGYFEYEIGSVSNVTILKTSQGSQEMRTAYVTFVVPEDAARLICDPNLQEKCRFTIKQAESVYQPQIDLNAMKFEEINDGSLMHIASFLNLIDTINLGKTCKRLQSFTENIFKKRTQFSFGSAKVYDLSINKKNLSTILQEMGKYIESIQFNHLDERQLDLLSKHCRNITELKLVNPHINSNMIKQNELVFKKIQTLEIRSAHLFDAQIYAMIKSSTNLKSLSLISCCNVRGKFFSVWKDSQLDHLKIAHCWGILPSSILDFQRANKLIKFSSDVHDSFISLLTLPTVCLFNYTELELAVNSSTDEKLECLKLDELKQIQKIHLKCSLPNLQLSYNLTKSYNYNNVFAAMSSIHSLNTLIVEKCIIDADTFKALGSIQNLREIILKNTELRVGNELYSSAHVHVPKLISLSMEMSFMSEEIDYASICDMISELIDLKYFFHAPMTWKLLEMIQQVRLLRKQPPIEIGISKMMFNDRRKKDFVARSKGAIILSLVN